MGGGHGEEGMPAARRTEETERLVCRAWWVARTEGRAGTPWGASLYVYLRLWR